MLPDNVLKRGECRALIAARTIAGGRSDETARRLPEKVDFFILSAGAKIGAAGAAKKGQSNIFWEMIDWRLRNTTLLATT